MLKVTSLTEIKKKIHYMLVAAMQKNSEIHFIHKQKGKFHPIICHVGTDGG
jgi:hypothetical protein